jgi:hypothetical protein
MNKVWKKIKGAWVWDGQEILDWKLYLPKFHQDPTPNLILAHWRWRCEENKIKCSVYWVSALPSAGGVLRPETGFINCLPSMANYLTNHLVGVTKNGRTNIYILFAPKVKLKLSTRESNRPSYLHTSKPKDQAVLFSPSISHIQLLQRLSVYLFCLLN